MKAPLPTNEQQRLTWLREARILDTEPEREFDEIVRLASELCGVPMATISLVDEERQWFKSVIGMSIRETPRDSAFCAHTILEPDLLVIEDAVADERFAENPLVTGDPGIRFYAGAPLINSEGHALGALCVIDRTPRQLTDEQRTLLKLLASQVAGRIELHRRIAIQEDLIVEREKAQEALRQREEQLNAIVEQAVDGIYLVDPVSRRIIKSNAAFRETLGYSETEIVELTLYDFIGHVRSSIEKNLAIIIEKRETVIGERQLVRKDGSIIVAEVKARMITYDGRDVICVLSTDLTAKRAADSARRTAEASFLNLFENAAEGIFRTTPQGQYLRVNPALASIYGYDSPGGMIRELTDISSQLYVETGRRDEFMRLMKENDSIVGFESQVRRRDGSVIWIAESARHVCDDSGRFSYYEGIVQDITDRKMLEAQRERELLEAQLRADRDSLTDLWNHRAFHNLVDLRLCRNAAAEQPTTLVMLDIDNFKFFNDLYGHVTGDAVLRMVADRLKAICGDGDMPARFGGDEFALLVDAPPRTREEIESEIKGLLDGLTFHPDGHTTAIPITVSVAASVSLGSLASRIDLLRDADERLRWARTGGQSGSADQMRAFLSRSIDGFSMLDALVTAVDNKDRYTRKHSEDVMEHCLVIAARLGLSTQERHNLAIAALLHDVGKIGVPDAILRKPGNLSDYEYATIKLHPQMGAAIVSAVPGLDATLDAVRHHHESLDGSGYPAGLAGTDIPLTARIMAVADAYSAMTMDRPYRKGMEPDRALSILWEGAGKHWDKDCVTAFLASRSEPAVDEPRRRQAA